MNIIELYFLDIFHLIVSQIQLFSILRQITKFIHKGLMKTYLAVINDL